MQFHSHALLLTFVLEVDATLSSHSYGPLRSSIMTLSAGSYSEPVNFFVGF